MKVFSAALVATTLVFTAGATASAQDVGKGKSVFNQCMACHALDHNVVGPKLAGVVGRKAGSISDYQYSPLMKAAGEAGLTWDEATLTEYLKGPTAYLKNYIKEKGKEASGSSKMSFAVSAEQARKNVVAYLATEK